MSFKARTETLITMNLMKWPLDTEYLCEKCGQSFQNKTAILSHYKWKHENSDHKCSGCERVFVSKWRLDRHQKTCQNIEINFFDCESSANTAAVQGHSSETPETPFIIKWSLNTEYLCEKCGQMFQNKASMLTHNKWKHENPNSNHKCDTCEKVFTNKCRLDKHQKNCSYNRTNKTCCFCDFTAPKRANIITHYAKHHNVNITKKILNFNTFEEFTVWKEKFEKDTKSHFIKRSQTQRTKSGVNISKYICHRDGYFRSRSKGIRRLKKVGSNKINSHCPANITVSETDHNIKVVYVDTHVGHELDLSRLSISESDKADIAQKLAMNIPFEQILAEIRDSTVNSEHHRIHLATRKDLWNIAASYNLTHVQNDSNNTPEEVICYEMDHLIDNFSEASGEEESVNVSEAAGDKEESGNISEAGGDKESAILRVVCNDRQPFFDERKQDMIDKLLQVCSTVENEEQLEAALNRVASLENIINTYSRMNTPIPETSKELPNTKI